MKITPRTLLATLAIAALGLTACGGDSDPGQTVGTSNTPSSTETTGVAPAEGGSITYAMWDGNQAPAYEACAATFAEETGIEVTIQQNDWGAYWTSLTNDLVAQTGPDVFVNTTSNYPDYATQGQIVDLTPLIERDGVDLEAYIPVTLNNWRMDEKYYGLPKDIDAIALSYDTAAVAEAGIDESVMADLDWNPDDGGSFGEVMKQLSLDEDGRNGLDPDFDATRVVRYGMGAPELNNIFGQKTYGNLIASMGTEFLTPNPFGNEWHFDDPAVVETISWFKQMQDDGFIQPAVVDQSVWGVSLFDSGLVGMMTNGSWDASVLAESTKEIAWAPMPAGPEGRKTFSNSIGDSINIHSENQDLAWEWVKYLGSPACQDQVATFGIVFPSLAESAPRAIDGYQEKTGVDMQPILDTILDAESTVSLPVANKVNQVSQLGEVALQEIYLNDADPAERLAQLQQEVEALG